MIYGDQKDSDILRQHIDFLIIKINIIGKSFEGNQVNLIQKTYLDLLRRVKCSLMGILKQLNYWPAEEEFKVPITLLFRACITDTLLLLYLKTIEEYESAFAAEIKLLDKAYVKFVKEFIESKGLSSDPDTIDSQLQNLHARATEAGILDNPWPNFTQKKAETIRGPKEKSPLLIDDILYKKDLIPKTQKLQLENNADFANLANSYWLYRFFSQHEHYAPANSSFIHTDQQFDCLQWYKALIIVFEAARLAGASLNASENLLHDIYEATEKLTGRLSDHYQDFDSSEAS